MIKNQLNKITLLGVILASMLLAFAGRLAAAGPSRADQTALELEMSSRLETMLEKLLGKDKCLVKISLTLFELPPGGSKPLPNSIRNIPSIIYPESQASGGEGSGGSVLIKNISAVIYLDDKLPQDKVDLVKTTVPKWLELDSNRGDTLTIESIPLGTEAAKDEVAAKQLSFLEKNLQVIMAIAGISVLGFILFILLFLSVKKFMKETTKTKAVEQKNAPDFNAVLESLKETLSAQPAQNIDTLLEDIKEILAKSSSAKTDSVLEEIKETLERIASTQQIGGTAAPAPGAAPQGTPQMPGGMASQEFLNALKEAMTPAAAPGQMPGAPQGPVGGGMGGTVSPEVVDALHKIENLMKIQVEANTASKQAIDEPIKYINTLSAKEILLLIEGEPARTAAIVLAHTDAVKSAEILGSIDAQRRVEVSVAMATLVENEDVVSEIRDFLQRKLPTVKLRADFAPVTGEKILTEILSSVSPEVASSIIAKIEKENPGLAKEIKKGVLTFEDIAFLEDKIVEDLAKGLPVHQLALALSIASDKVKDKFYKNISESATKKLKEESEALRILSQEEGYKQIVVFEDILSLSNPVIQEILRTQDRDTIKLALRATSEDVRQKFYGVMSERGAAILREDIEVMAPLPHSRYEEAQKKILDKIHNLETERLIAQQEIVDKLKLLKDAGRF